MSLSGHQSARMKNDEWLTPPEIIKPLGKFDLDPCSPVERPWATANEHLTVDDDGLWHHGTVHYCKGMNMKQTNNLLSVLEEINMLACYASEEAIETRESTLLRIGEIARSALAQPQGYYASMHPDDLAVEMFAAAMKVKLAKKRAEGRGGWEDKSLCSQEFLSDLLHGHIAKGDPVDVANFCMMLYNRGEAILPQPQGEPVYYQWRRKNQPWSIRHVYHNKVEATTDDSEVRELYTTPPSVEAAIEATKEKVIEVVKNIDETHATRMNVIAAIRSIK